MTTEEFRTLAHRTVDWMADYYENINDYPVKSRVTPGAIYQQLSGSIPSAGEDFEQIFQDFENIIMPGVTHWQSPNFFAYFQANSSPPSVLAEMLTATLALQCMKWDTSPAAAELEERMMQWLMGAIGIPESWSGVIQDTASTATLAAILTARETLTNWSTNKSGLSHAGRLRVYCSAETHSSIEKGAKIAGIGSDNVIKVEVDEMCAMRADHLISTIEMDLASGHKPLCIVATLGTTGTLAMDPLKSICEIAKEHQIWVHVDAAYAGSALILPEYQNLIEGIEMADSFVFNPHKWLFTNFDCSAYFVKDEKALVKTFAILPEYLKTRNDGFVNNYCDWGIPLGRRFRALKLWFVMRSYGLAGLQQKLRNHIEYAEWLEQKVKTSKDFEMVIPRTMNLVCFRFIGSEGNLNAINAELLEKVNNSGKVYLTHTVVAGDTLAEIAVQYNVTLESLARANNIEDYDHIEVGQVLIIPGF